MLGCEREIYETRFTGLQLVKKISIKQNEFCYFQYKRCRRIPFDREPIDRLDIEDPFWRLCLCFNSAGK